MTKQPFDFLEHAFSCLSDAKRICKQAKTEEGRNTARAFEAATATMIREYLATLNDKAGF